MWPFLSSVVGVWRNLNPGVRGFILGVAAGLALLSGLWHDWSSTKRADRIALENANAALDSTRKISAGHDTVYARLLAQKDVELAGALADVARSRRSRPRATVAVGVVGRGIDTTARHPAVGSRQPAIRSDSIVFTGPPVAGRVAVTVTDSAFYWSAKLRPSPVDLTLALTCGKAGAEVLAHGPPWVSTSIGGGQVDPAVCHPAPSKWFSGFKSGVVVTGTAFVVLRLLGVVK